MQIIPYLNFNGQCADAFKFYEQCLGGKIVMMQTHGDSPIAGQVPPEWHGRILHARLEVGDAVLMASDRPPGQDDETKGSWVTLVIDDLDRAQSVFNALADSGKVQMPFAETFWATRFGMCVDRFGTPWMINCQLVK
jgi:PhnB protein